MFSTSPVPFQISSIVKATEKGSTDMEETEETFMYYHPQRSLLLFYIILHFLIFSNREASMVPMNSTGMGDMEMGKTMMTHMTFYWGKSVEIFFSGWPGQSSGMYGVALVTVFLLSMLVEWLSHTSFIKPTTNKLVAGLVQTAMYGLRIGLAYLVMLAVMSFNLGVLLVAIAGYTAGFLLFGSRVFRDSSDVLPYEKASDLPPLNC